MQTTSSEISIILVNLKKRLIGCSEFAYTTHSYSASSTTWLLLKHFWNYRPNYFCFQNVQERLFFCIGPEWLHIRSENLFGEVDYLRAAVCHKQRPLDTVQVGLICRVRAVSVDTLGTCWEVWVRWSFLVVSALIQEKENTTKQKTPGKTSLVIESWA